MRRRGCGPNEHGAVALLTPDAPLVQFGDFHFGPPPEAIERVPDPLLLSWVANNADPRARRARARLHGPDPAGARGAGTPLLRARRQET